MSTPGSVIPLLLGSTATTYNVERSLRFNSSDSAFLSRTPASAGNRKTWTWAGWVKRSALGSQQAFFSGGTPDSADFFVSFESDDTLRLIALSSGTPILQWKTSQVFRDPGSWYHIVFAVDTTQATATNRVALYVNGSQVTTFGTQTTPAQDTEFSVNATQIHGIGYRAASGGFAYFSGYLADIHFIDGQALDPTSFTEVSATTGQLMPKAYTGTFTGNSFWLKFADNSAATATTLGKDSSGLGNNWTPNNLSVTAGAGNDSLVDTPTSGSQVDTGLGGQVTGNYATFNPINLTPSSSHSLTNGNLEVIGGTGWTSDVSTFPTGATGKWYAEITLAGTFATAPFIGIAKNTSITSSYIGSSSDSYGYRADATKWNGGSSAYGATYTAGDTIGIAYDADAGTLVFYKNGVSQGTAYSGLSGSFFIGGSFWTSSTTVNAIANFGQRPFAYTAPSGFKALCDTNLPTPVVAKGSSAMDVLTWTGNSASSRALTGLGFSPDFVWIKDRSNGYNHVLFDAVRGAGGSKVLFSNRTTAEGGGAGEEGTNYGAITSFDSSGFTVAPGAVNSVWVNQSSDAYVAWAWDAGSSTVTNTQGSITSSVRANASAGFSVVTYTGNGTNPSTVGHGLGVAPSFIIHKCRSDATNWFVYHRSAGNGALEGLNTTAVYNAGSGAFGSTAPTSTVLTTGGDTNTNGRTYVDYCFAPVAGYSSFGSYTGNGSTDGPFVYTGFRPRWVMIKNSSANSIAAYGSWKIIDTSRDTYNGSNPSSLYANASYAEGKRGNGDPDTYTERLDLLSNGFKLGAASSYDIETNESGVTYIYAAFAENPFQYARAR